MYAFFPHDLTHTHRLNHSSHLRLTSSSVSLAQNFLQSLTCNCLLHTYLWTLHKHLQLNLYKIKHIVYAQQTNVLLLLCPVHQPTSVCRPESLSVIWDSSLLPLRTSLTLTQPLPSDYTALT